MYLKRETPIELYYSLFLLLWHHLLMVLIIEKPGIKLTELVIVYYICLIFWIKKVLNA
jgi:hypothetical protein